MIVGEPIGWINTGAPLALLAGLAFVLPQYIVPRETRSHRAVMVTILVSGVGLLVAGVGLFGLVYDLRGAEISLAISMAPLATALFFLRLSVMAALLWGPILALVWFTMAQRVETRRGEDIMRGDP